MTRDEVIFVRFASLYSCIWQKYMHGIMGKADLCVYRFFGLLRALLEKLGEIMGYVNIAHQARWRAQVGNKIHG